MRDITGNERVQLLRNLRSANEKGGILLFTVIVLSLILAVMFAKYDGKSEEASVYLKEYRDAQHQLNQCVK